MSKKRIAIALAAGAAFVYVVTSSTAGDDAPAGHTMPGGQVMQGERMNR